MGRGSTDNAIVVMEALLAILSRESRLISARNNMAIKLNLSKAYDQVSWEFLKFMLHKF